MSDGSYSDHPVLNELFDEEPTDPDIGAVQLQLDRAESLVTDGFLARGRALGYGQRETGIPSWMERLDRSLEVSEEEAS